MNTGHGVPRLARGAVAGLLGRTRISAPSHASATALCFEYMYDIACNTVVMQIFAHE